jgi:SAM-dependent methyltransferase
MSEHTSDKAFTGSIPAMYETYLVPLIFEAYAADLATRVAQSAPRRVLEIAAGTGVVTRAMASALPAGTSIVATDLNQAMLDHAATIDISRPVEWRQADAMSLPFGDGEFDAVVCQFGAMFFPNRANAYAQARRVLKPGGVFVFNVWDRIEWNEFAECVQTAADAIFPSDPPRFLARAPYGYSDTQRIRADIAEAGFAQDAQITTLPERSRAPSPRHPARGFCEGSPLRSEIEARDAARLTDVVDRASQLIAQRFGTGAVDARMQAHVIVART